MCCVKSYGALRRDARSPPRDLSHGLPAVARGAHNGLNRHSLVGQASDSGVRFLAPQEAVVLQALNISKTSRVEVAGAQSLADRAHRFAHDIQEGLAGILHEVPLVGYLSRAGLRQGHTLDRLSRKSGIVR